MEDRKLRCSRRKFLAQAAAALTLSGGLPRGSASGGTPPTPPAGRRPLAVVCTVYRPLSYAHHLAARFLHGYPQGGRLHVPSYALAALCVEQAPDNDLSRTLAREHGVRVTRSVADALTGGGRTLAVDGVLLVGEHGNYPRNERGQILYPRFELLGQVVEVFRRTGRSVPVYLAKHLSHDPARARQMAAWAEELSFPLMAGGYLPAAWRRPELELPMGAAVEEGLVVGYGPVEVYGFHALEALQTMLERRRGGETGVRAVTCLTGRDVWRAGDAGRWGPDLLEAALARSETAAPGDVRQNVGRLAVPGMPAAPASAFLVEYRDGTRGTALLLNGHVQDFTFAARLQGESRPAACLFVLPPPPGCRHFDCLAAAVEGFLQTGRSPYPVGRALLTTAALAAAMESHHRRGAPVETPDLDVRYPAPADGAFCRGWINPL
jgi:hypothetical protein